MSEDLKSMIENSLKNTRNKPKIEVKRKKQKTKSPHERHYGPKRNIHNHLKDLMKNIKVQDTSFMAFMDSSLGMKRSDEELGIKYIPVILGGAQGYLDAYMDVVQRRMMNKPLHPRVSKSIFEVSGIYIYRVDDIQSLTQLQWEMRLLCSTQGEKLHKKSESTFDNFERESSFAIMKRKYLLYRDDMMSIYDIIPEQIEEITLYDSQKDTEVAVSKFLKKRYKIR